MSSGANLIFTKIKVSIAATAWLLRKWRYATFALLVALLFFELLYWSFNLQVAGAILGSPSLSLPDKLQVAISPFSAIYQAKGGLLTFMMISLAVIQGIIMSGLVYIVHAMRRVDDGLVGSGVLVTALAVIGVGCPSCGTSLITPVVALFVSGSAVAVSEQIANTLTPIALLLALAGIYVVGLRIAGMRARSRQKDALENLL